MTRGASLAAAPGSGASDGAAPPARSRAGASATGIPQDGRVDPAQHLGLAYKIAREEWARRPIRLCTREDFEQTAMVGLCDAVTRFRPELGYTFATFAVETIRCHLKGLRAGNHRIVNYNGRVCGSRLRSRLRSRGWRWEAELAPEAVCAAIGRSREMSEEEAHRLVGYATGRDVFIADLATYDEFAAEETMPYEDNAEGMGGAEDAHDRMVGEAWASLVAAFRRDVAARPNPVEAAVLERRLLADEGERATLEDVGDAFGLSRERVRQIEARLLVDLRYRAQRLGLVLRGERWGVLGWSAESLAQRAQKNGAMTDTSLSPPATHTTWTDAARELFAAILRGKHHDEARRVLRDTMPWSQRVSTAAAAVDHSLIVIAPDYAAVDGLYGLDDLPLPGVRTRGIRAGIGEVVLHAVPLEHLGAALARRWRRDVPAIERAYAAAGPRGEETAVLLTRVRSVVVTMRAVAT